MSSPGSIPSQNPEFESNVSRISPIQSEFIVASKIGFILNANLNLVRSHGRVQNCDMVETKFEVGVRSISGPNPSPKLVSSPNP